MDAFVKRMDHPAVTRVVGAGREAAKSMWVRVAVAFVALIYLVRRTVSAPRGEAVDDAPMRSPSERKGGRVRITKMNECLFFLTRLTKVLSICAPLRNWGKEAGCLFALVVLLIVRTLCGITHVRLGANTASHFVSRRWGPLRESLTYFVLMSIPATCVNAGLKVTQTHFSNIMRKNLTTHINEKYFADNGFLKSAHRPDEIQTTDVKNFTDRAANVLCYLLKPLADLLIYNSTLAWLVGWQGPAIIWSFFIVRYNLKGSLRPQRHRSVKAHAHWEGEFKKMHTRLQNDKDEVAINRTAERDREVVDMLLAKADATLRSTADVKLAVQSAFDTLLIRYGASVAGYGVLLSPYVLGLRRVLNKTSVMMVRDYIVVLKCLTELNRAVGEIESSFETLSGIEGTTLKIAQLIDDVTRPGPIVANPTERGIATEKMDSHSPPENSLVWVDAWLATRKSTKRVDMLRAQANGDMPSSHVPCLAMHHVDITAPDGTRLIRDLSFSLARGDNLLITGRKQTGKTAIFRVLSGVWPAAGAAPTIIPPASAYMYLSHSPHLIYGTLRDQIIYPDPQAKFSNRASDTDLAKLLAMVDHSQSILGTWSLNDVRDWPDCLSETQKQCLGIARLFYHLPDFAFLDDCMDCLPESVEAYVYELLGHFGITFITATDGATRKLECYHSKRLTIQNGSYVVEDFN